MNQVTNVTQFKNLSEEDQKDHNFYGGYSYSKQRTGDSTDFGEAIQGSKPFGTDVYRLVIEPAKWYMTQVEEDESPALDSGKSLSEFNLNLYHTVRPAREDEIPKVTELPLEGMIQQEYPGRRVMMLEWKTSMWSLPSGYIHSDAVSVKGFAGFVYIIKGLLKVSSLPLWPNTHLKPVAVLIREED